MIIYIISQVRDFTSSNSWLSRAAMCKCSHFKFHSPILRIPGLCLFFFILLKSCHFSHNADLHDLLGHSCRLLPSSQVSCLCNQAEHQFITDAREHVIYHLAILLVFCLYASKHIWCPCKRAQSSCNQTTSAWCPCQGARSLPSCHPACVHHLRGIPSWGSLCKRELQPQQQVELAKPFWTSCII